MLGCCFSGSFSRHGEQDSGTTRTTPYKPAIGAAYPLNIDLVARLQAQSGTLRDATEVITSVLDPDGYTMLAACGQDEFAKELIVGGNTRSGALSHFRLQALKAQRGMNVSIRALHNHLRLKFDV